MKKSWLGFAGLLAFSQVPTAYAIPAQVPLYLAQAVTPIMMLNMSTDHQLYFKVYDDYGDLTDTRATINGVPNPNYLKNVGDGVADTTYIHGYQYYGYFDSKKCYVYSTSNNRFEPSRFVDTAANNLGYCNYVSGVTNEWSGSFLNWATMTRIDIVRKILYGGLRSTDTGSTTVLERAYLPTDAHAFTKYYNKADLPKLTPVFTQTVTTGAATQTSGITFCNVTRETSGYSQDSTQPPLIRVVKGNYSLWASSERWQCRWGVANGSLIGKNGNDPTKTQINASDYAPLDSDTSKKLSITGLSNNGEYVVRVKVCASSTLLEDNCQQYPSASYPNKPIGVLQKYGETNQLNFGLITGSHGRNKSGGVLRKNVGNMLDEINSTTNGTFKTAPTTGGIINTLNLLRMFGYAYDGADPGAYRIKDSCTYGLETFSDGNCSNWGNPQSEIYYESLRYLSGLTATPAYTWVGNEDQHYIAGLTQATWTKPVTNANYCAPLSILQFNASTSSYDSGDDANYTGLSDIGLTDTNALNALTDLIGDKEGISGTLRFVGRIINGSGTDINQLCTAKTVNKLSTVSGTCPDSPRLNGGYNIVGLARYARDRGIHPSGVTKGTEKNRYGEVANIVRTYGVALAPSVPKVEVLVPDTTTGKKIIIQPACRNHANISKPTNCAIVDFKIVNQDSTTNNTDSDFPLGLSGNFGNLYVSWEDSEQGGDYDQDMWGVIKYFVSATKVYVKTRVLAQSSTQPLGFGYILTGTSSDGFHVHSGILGFTYTDPLTNIASCSTTSGNRCTCRNDGAFDVCDPNLDGGRMQSYNITNSTATFLQSPLYYAAKWGGYDRSFEQENLASLDTAITNRSVNDSYFYATDPNALAQQLASAFESIASDIKSSGGVATNNPRLSNDSFLFQTKFNTFNWSGELLALKYGSDGTLLKDSNGAPVVAASTADSGRMPISQAGRTVYTNNVAPAPITSSTYPQTPVTFNWNNLNSSERSLLVLSAEGSDTTLAQKRVDWLLGNIKDEASQANGVFRNRTNTNGVRNILGDLVNSSPVYVGAQDYNFSHLPGNAGSSYAAYVKTKVSKKPLIFIGSNDGMVHAFDASYVKSSNGSISTPDMFKEVYAYIPQMAFPKLANLTRTDYGRSSNAHQYIVDGPIATSDVYINNAWRTIIVGTLGAGGRGVYALDVTDAIPKVLFEITDTTCSVATLPCPSGNLYYKQLGYVMGTPVILPMTNGRFAVIFGNGDTTGTTSLQPSALFVIDIEKPFDANYSKVIPTIGNAGSGLSSPEILPNSLGQASIAYAGDLSGNLWRFNLIGGTGATLTANETPSPANWHAEYLLFQAKDAANNIQPIFAAPTLGYNPVNGKVMVYFGTGKYYDTGDNAASATPVHSIYAIADVGADNVPVTRSTLKQKVLITSGSGSTQTRAEDLTSDNQPVWNGDNANNGWYLNLPATSERITTTPILVDDKLIFPTIIPSSDPCIAGGNSWIMELVATGAFTFTNAHVLDKDILSDGLILGNLNLGTRPNSSNTSSSGNTSSTSNSSASGSNCAGKGAASGSNSNGEVQDVSLNLEMCGRGRQSWRQLR